MILYADVLSESKQGAAGGKKGSVAHKWLQKGGGGMRSMPPLMGNFALWLSESDILSKSEPGAAGMM